MHRGARSRLSSLRGRSPRTVDAPASRGGSRDGGVVSSHLLIIFSSHHLLIIWLGVDGCAFRVPRRHRGVVFALARFGRAPLSWRTHSDVSAVLRRICAPPPRACCLGLVGAPAYVRWIWLPSLVSRPRMWEGFTLSPTLALAPFTQSTANPHCGATLLAHGGVCVARVT